MTPKEYAISSNAALLKVNKLNFYISSRLLNADSDVMTIFHILKNYPLRAEEVCLISIYSFK